VMAPGDQIFPQDLPAEMLGQGEAETESLSWAESLRHWARRELAAGGSDLYGRAQEGLERVLIQCALDQTGGQRLKAAELLGLGRNTLTRKLQKMENEREDGQQPLRDQAAGGT